METLDDNKEVLPLSQFMIKGQSIRNTMKLTGKSSGTVRKIKKLID